MKSRRYRSGDAVEVSELIRYTLRTTSIQDYSEEYIENLCRKRRPEDIERCAESSHFYVMEDDCGIAACGAIALHSDDCRDSILLNIFVHPRMQGKGTGRELMQVLENDEYFHNTGRTVLHASITAVGFYLRLGYGFHNGVSEPDSFGVVLMEKIHPTCR